MDAPTKPRGSRRDARRNRARVVAAAREAFASAGVEVPAREVARRAGVGVGTLYRHFESRDDLVDAVLEDAYEELVGIAEAALAEADAWAGFVRFVEEALALHMRNRGLQDVETRAHGSERTSAMRRRIAPLLRELVERAQGQGTLRRDFVPEDFPLLFWSCDRVLDLAATVAPELWRRHLGLLLDGLRAGAATPLAHPPLTRAELQRIGHERRRQA